MVTKGNYLIQLQQAKARFLTYDQQRLIRKLRLEQDARYLYPQMLAERYRICRADGALERLDGQLWQDANTFEEVMTLLDLICDSREDRFVTGNWKSMESFGLMFHQNLLQDTADPMAQRIDRQPEAFCHACRVLGGQAMEGGDLGYAVTLFEQLRIYIRFWHSDEEFLPRLRYLWDENANMYLRYETMYYAVGLLKRRLSREMDRYE